LQGEGNSFLNLTAGPVGQENIYERYHLMALLSTSCLEIFHNLLLAS